MATTITLADLTACNDGTVLVAKGAVDGSRRHISQVANGLSCGCVCFGCERTLVAKNGGDVKRHHFAHQPNEVTANCASAGETALHILGKEIIARHRRVTMPETSVIDLDGKRRPVTPRRSVALTDIHLETAEGEIIPDIIATTPDGRRLFIEIKNTHGCPPEKLLKLAAMDVDVLEIDVSGYRDHSLDALDEIILDQAPRIVIQSAALNARYEKREAEKEQREADRQGNANRKIAVYRERATLNSKRASDLADQMIALGFSEFMDLDDLLPSAFRVPRRQWQAAILFRLKDTKYPGMVGAVPMSDRLRDRNWPKPDLNILTTEEAKWIRTNVDAEFKSSYEEVVTYLRRLHKANIVHEDKSRFYLTQDVRQQVENTETWLGLPSARKALAEAALGAIQNLMTPEDGAWIDFGQWLEERAGNFGTTMTALLADEESQFDDLMSTLEDIRSTIVRMKGLWHVEPPDDMAGLPLGKLFLRLQAALSEAQAKAEQERDDRLNRDADARVSEITKAATSEFSDPNAWLTTPRTAYGNKTPQQLAAEGHDGLAKANVIMAQAREDRRTAELAEARRKIALDQLENEAARRILRQDMASLWLNSSSKDLGGAKPVVFCQDDKSLERCLEVLRAFVKNEQKRKGR